MSGTASENVSILDESFYFPSLPRHRRIWVYKPAGYDTSERRYPVIYMHDGQNLFDELTAFGSEWGVDEALDAERGKVIVIGIDNGGEHRMNEYMLHDHEEYGQADGTKYLKDVVELLKHYVDSILRTNADCEHTCIAGSSMGGLISLYAGLHYPYIFGAVGVFSPSLWVDTPRIFDEARETLAGRRAVEANPQRWFFYAGARESETMISDVAGMVHIMRESPLVSVTYQLDAEGIHDEAVWKNYFPNLYKWFIGKKPDEVVEQESHLKIE